MSSLQAEAFSIRQINQQITTHGIHFLAGALCSLVSRNPCFLCHAVKNSFLSQQVQGRIKLDHQSFVKNHDPENYNNTKNKQQDNRTLIICPSLLFKDDLQSVLRNLRLQCLSKSLSQMQGPTRKLCYFGLCTGFYSTKYALYLFPLTTVFKSLCSLLL